MGGAVFPPCYYLGPNYGGDNEDNGDLFPKVPCMHCSTQCPQPCSRPLLTHASVGDSRTLMSKSGSLCVGSLLLSPWSWCAQGSVCALQESIYWNTIIAVLLRTILGLQYSQLTGKNKSI